MPQRAGHLVVVLALASSSLTACDGETTGLDPALAVTCGADGVLHAGVVGNERWTPADNPHAVVDTLNVEGVLTLEPGVVVCVEPRVPILIGQDGAALDATGTADAPIVFTAGDPDDPWGGIIAPSACHSPSFEDAEPCSAGETTIAHARIEHAEYGIRAGARARVEHTHFRQIGCTAAAVSHLRHSRVDSAGLDGCAAVAMGVALSLGGADLFEDNVIVGSGGAGLSFDVYRKHTSSVVGGGVVLLGGRIEDSGGPGLTFTQQYYGSVVSAARPLRITGGAGVPVRAPLGAVMQIWPTVADQDSLKGNAGDTIVSWGGIEDRAVIVAPGIILKNVPHYLLPSIIASPEGLRIEPGGTLTGELWIRGPLHAEGTPATPARITSGFVVLQCPGGGGCDAGSRLTDVILDQSELHGSAQRLRIERLNARASTLSIGPGSTVVDLVIQDAPGAGLELWPGHGPGLVISRCTVRRSGLAGILVSGTGVGGATIRDCAFESNGGPGVRNAGSGAVDARFNWWGDPAGPLGPAGDGVEGDVDYSDYLTAPPSGS